MGDDNLSVGTRFCWHFGALFAGSSDLVFCGWFSLLDARAGVGGVVEIEDATLHELRIRCMRGRSKIKT